MGKLSDILTGNAGDFATQWDTTEAAGDFGAVPRGEYVCHVTTGELESSRTNRTPGYKIEFVILEGDFKGRRLWLDLWLTAAALAQSKRDLGKLGITSPEMMERPLPRGIRCKVTVVLRKDDSGIERNRIRSFEVVGIDKPVVDEFAPKPPGDAAEPTGEADTTFNPADLKRE